MRNTDECRRLSHAVTLNHRKSEVPPETFSADRQCGASIYKGPKFPTKPLMHPTGTPDAADKRTLLGCDVTDVQIAAEFLFQAFEKSGDGNDHRNSFRSDPFNHFARVEAILEVNFAPH